MYVYMACEYILFIWYEVWRSLGGYYRGLQTPGNGPAFGARDSDPEALKWDPGTCPLTSISQFLWEGHKPHVGKHCCG